VETPETQQNKVCLSLKEADDGKQVSNLVTKGSSLYYVKVDPFEEQLTLHKFSKGQITDFE